ncbi:MAG: hypothetical protein QGI08_15060 [Paracoccaceae bacterium]|jgi:hypothetical protein|nr:hypothetical protein [Paracoccaceae bacterium]MDP7187035.1 hypothetical protein [Paracoccaceae bacterium]
MRVSAGLDASTVLGWDMSAALALGTALGVPALAIAELLPAMEGAMVRKANEGQSSGGREGCDRSP